MVLNIILQNRNKTLKNWNSAKSGVYENFGKSKHHQISRHARHRGPDCHRKTFSVGGFFKFTVIQTTTVDPSYPQPTNSLKNLE